MKCPACQQENVAAASVCRACGAPLPTAANATRSRIERYGDRLESASRDGRWREVLAAYALLQHLEAATESHVAKAAQAERVLRRRRWKMGLPFALVVVAALAWAGVREYRANQHRQTLAAEAEPPPAPTEAASPLAVSLDDGDDAAAPDVTQVDDANPRQVDDEATVTDGNGVAVTETESRDDRALPPEAVAAVAPALAVESVADEATVGQAPRQKARERMVATVVAEDWPALAAFAAGDEADALAKALAGLVGAANAHARALDAKARGDWRTVADALQDVDVDIQGAYVKLGKENEEEALKTVAKLDAAIRALLAEANDHLLPRLTITSLVDGEAVAGATVVILDADGTPLAADAPRLTPATVALTRGAAYTIRVALPPQGETRFLPAEIAYKVERDGPQALAVDLVPWDGPFVGEAWTVPEVAIVLVPIAAGRFRMGAANGARDERPIHEVKLSKPYWLGKHEVTQAAYEALAGRHSSRFEGANLPVESVSWEDAADYCRRLTARESNAGRLPEGYVCRLPTEAEWEYACRAGSVADYAYGNGSARLGDYAWYVDNSGERTHEVGVKKPNAWGLHDLHGNVWEWCHDWAGPYVAGPASDPAGPATGTDRAVRGGGWDATAAFCRSAFRLRAPPANAYPFIGFRIALAPELP